jgi:methylase of polypeptide subunit release factors
MKTVFRTPTKDYLLKADPFTCNRFGLAEYFARSFQEAPATMSAQVLDVGCGVGPISIFLADQFKCKVIGVELNGLACRNCMDNFSEQLRPGSASVIEADFSAFENHPDSGTFDLIVSNPPVSSASILTETPYPSDDAFKNPTAETFAFLTNCWRDPFGRDLLELLFDYSTRHLVPVGAVVIAFCEIDGATLPFVLAKAKRFGFAPRRIVSEFVTAESIGARHLDSDRIPAHYVVFEIGR